LNSISNSNLAEDEEAGMLGIIVQDQDEGGRSRMKTVSFSQNGYSVELIKVAQSLRNVHNGGSAEEGNLEVQLPPGFENNKAFHVVDSCIYDLKGCGLEELHLGNGNELSLDHTISEPPGFEKDQSRIKILQVQG